jgi:rubrerythrin
MSASTDAVWIVKELLEEIIGMTHFRKVQEEFEARKGEGESEMKEEHDWVSLINAEEQEMIGKEVKPVDEDAAPVDCDFCFDKCICDEVDAEMKEMIDGDKKSSNQKDIVIEKKEVKFPKYETMRFNWKEVDPIFKGQLEKMDDITDDFRYVYIELIDGFSACKFRCENFTMLTKCIYDRLTIFY